MEKEKINIKMFGLFDIEYNGRSIFLETGSSVKTVEMLKFLLAQKDKVFTAEAIAGNVWPENEYLDEKKVIRTYIHRLRKILILENYFKRDFSDEIRIVNVKGGYKAEISDDVRLDIDLFEEYKEDCLKVTDETSVLDAYEKINAIYSGEFLEECRYDHWAIMFRNYYLRAFSTVVSHILRILEENSNYEKILDIAERSLKIYELDENINVFFLNALIETDQIANALKHYSLITSKMYTELSMSPSEKLREIYARIKTYKKQEDAIGGLDTDDNLLDRQGLFNMVNDIVKAHLSLEFKYSIAYIEVYKLNDIGEIINMDMSKLQDEEKLEIAESLKYAMEYALRKNDMYTVISQECKAIVVLYDAKMEFYQNIINRITNAFYSRYSGFKYKIKMQIHKAAVIN